MQILFPRTTSTTHKLRKYNSLNSLPIHRSLSRLQLHVHSYTIHNLISPHRHCLYNNPPPHATPARIIACRHLHGVNLHRHTQPGQRTRAIPRLHNVHVENLGPDLRRRYPLHTNPSRTSRNFGYVTVAPLIPLATRSNRGTAAAHLLGLQVRTWRDLCGTDIKSLQDFTKLIPLSGIGGYTMDTQPSAPGSQ